MKKLLILLSAIFFTAGVFAVEVNEKELESTGGEDVVRFENYNGPHSVIETASQISSIGSGLGRRVASSVNSSGTFSNGKYSVIHAVDPSEQGKLDADILIIGANATVDHIKNLRRIIASYLVEAYGYGAKDAQTIATFVTVYNAVYRGKLDTFKSKYKNVVTKNLDASKCGLSVKWSEWAGNSQIVIPLNDISGGLSTVDTSVISDKSVVKSMQEEDNKGVEDRKNMVDIKEREAEKASEKADKAEKKAQEDEKALKKQQEAQKKAEQTAQNKKSEADAAKKAADEKAKEAAANPSDKEKAKEAQEARQEAEEKAQEAREAAEEASEEAQKTEEAERQASESASEAQEAREEAEKKADEARSEREEIAKDQQEIVTKALNEANGQNSVIGLKVTDSGAKLSSMVRVDGATGETLKESPVTVIRARTILPVENAQIDAASQAVNTLTDSAVQIDTKLLYMAICGENTGTGAVKLCLLDAYLMEIQKESAETVAEDSVLVEKNGSYYCVITDNGSNKLAKYDKNLKLLTKSQISVNPATPVTITDKGIIVTDDSGRIVLLKESDLTQVTQSQTAPASSTGYEK